MTQSAAPTARKYETIVVFKPDLTETQIKDEEKKLEGILKTAGATTVATESWGRKDIAYLVRKNKSGTFVRFNYESKRSDTVEEFTGTLRITDSVIKFQTHRHADKVRKFKGNPKRPVGSDQGFDYMDSDDSY